MVGCEGEVNQGQLTYDPDDEIAADDIESFREEEIENIKDWIRETFSHVPDKKGPYDNGVGCWFYIFDIVLEFLQIDVFIIHALTTIF